MRTVFPFDGFGYKAKYRSGVTYDWKLDSAIKNPPLAPPRRGMTRPAKWVSYLLTFLTSFVRQIRFAENARITAKRF